MDSILDRIRLELKDKADEVLQKSSQKFFKETIRTYGIKNAVINETGKRYFSLIKDKSKTEIFDLCDELWRSGYLEESIIACNWAYSLRKKYGPEDFPIFRHWVNDYVNNWASCDTLCNHTIGSFIDEYPSFLEELKEWTQSGNRWMKRASAVTLIIPARQGRFLKEVLGIADLLLSDKDDMVQKGYGWMLKAASQSHGREVFDYVMKQKNLMPRTAFRYAIEKMPVELKARAMEK